MTSFQGHTSDAVQPRRMGCIFIVNIYWQGYIRLLNQNFNPITMTGA
jgi:hypothetical protein